MRWFLDMNIILYHFGEGDRPDLNKKSVEFVKNKKQNTFLLCYYIKEKDIPKWLRRQKILYREILKSLKEDSYKIYSSNEAKNLTSRDRKKGIKLLTLFRKMDSLEAINRFEKIFLYLEQQINEFLKKYVDEFVVPIGEIDQELRSHLMSFINIVETKKNYSDLCILSSAVQEHNNEELSVITADKKDIEDNLLEEITFHPDLSKKYPKIPGIVYLQNL